MEQVKVPVLNTTLKGRQKTAVLSAVTILLIFLAASFTIFVVIGMCSSFVLLHSVFHVPDDDTAFGVTELEDMSQSV